MTSCRCARSRKAAGISHALLYRYFPSKQGYFRAALEQAAEELRARTAPDPSLPPWEQLVAGLEGFSSWSTRTRSPTGSCCAASQARPRSAS